MRKIEGFDEYRKKMNQRILEIGNLTTKRFWALDSEVYRAGTLDEKTKELLGLATSTVLKCDDCISYHIIRCIQLGISDEELVEALNIALIVGGSITIPHIRRAIETIDECRKFSQEELERLL